MPAEAEVRQEGLNEHFHAYSHLLIKKIQLRVIIRSIRSSPQRRQEWIGEVKVSAPFKAGKLGTQPLMPILDVRTRWSSTHQMLRRNFLCSVDV